MKYIFTLFAWLVLAWSAQANMYLIPEDGSRLIGQLQTHEVTRGEHFHEIGRIYGVGMLELMEANPGIDPFLPEAGTKLIIPTMMLLPDVKRKGIVINLAELRLYYFHRGGKEVSVFPIGIGRIGRATPVMTTSISNKRANPTWTPTANTRKEYAAKGITLPAVVQAGPDNPLGLYALRLAYGRGEYLIHGTNKDFGIGMRVSAGCIRLEPPNIEWLFNQVKQGDPVKIINEPVKRAVEPSGEIIVEVHSPLSKTEDSEPEKLEISDEMIAFVTEHETDVAAVINAFDKMNGLPLVLGTKQVEEIEEIDYNEDLF